MQILYIGVKFFFGWLYKIGVARRSTPETSHGKRNVLGPRLKAIRRQRGLRAVAVVEKLQRRGWDISPAVFSHLEAGNRFLTDVELLLLLKVLGASLRDLDLR